MYVQLSHVPQSWLVQQSFEIKVTRCTFCPLHPRVSPSCSHHFSLSARFAAGCTAAPPPRGSSQGGSLPPAGEGCQETGKTMHSTVAFQEFCRIIRSWFSQQCASPGRSSRPVKGCRFSGERDFSFLSDTFFCPPRFCRHSGTSTPPKHFSTGEMQNLLAGLGRTNGSSDSGTPRLPVSQPHHGSRGSAAFLETPLPVGTSAPRR